MINRFAFQFLIILALTSCNSFYKDHSKQLVPVPISTAETGVYVDVAWINEDTIAAVVKRDNTFVGNKRCTQEDLLTLNLKSRQVQLIDLDLEKDCMGYIISNLQKLPDQNIGYLFSSFGIDSDNGFVRHLEVKEGDYSLLEEYLVTADQFAYSPTMREIIVTRVDGIDASKTFLVKDNGEEIDISPGFARAKSPAWSGDNIIAFFGTNTFEKEKEPIIQFYSFEKYLGYPWQLYMYDPITAEIQELPLEVVDPGKLKWSPDSKTLGFRGSIKGIRGVWLVSNLDDPDNLFIVRIVDAEATFDFSPDGESIVFAYIGLQNKDKQDQLYIVTLPSE
ncbi:MAG: hypothetical protein QY328_10230 [Anaerolineales bacterium]|nr:MAG: hypothetical protein QY328_10230 [Anaerolineales bacterium]